MRIVTPIVTSLSALLLLLFAHEFRPGTFFSDAGVAGVPLWSICTLLGVALVVVTGDQLRRRRRVGTRLG